MKVEIDISEVEWGAFYKDEKCKELEKILRCNPRYAACQVKRGHWNDESTDPFYVLDESGEEIVRLERWEVDALDDSEVLPFIEVQQRRNRPLDLLEILLDGLFIAVGSMAAGFHVYALLNQSSALPTPWSIFLDFISLLLGILCILKYRKSAKQKKDADLEAARKDPSYLGLLRKLAEVPETENPSKKEFVKRLEYIENAIAGFN
jgi:hypothetical protein